MLIIGAGLIYLGVKMLAFPGEKYVVIAEFFAALLSIIAGCFYCNKSLYKKNLTEWERKTNLLELGWICHKCGNAWIPE